MSELFYFKDCFDIQNYNKSHQNYAASDEKKRTEASAPIRNQLFFTPDIFARLFVIHLMFKAVHRLCIFGTADIQSVPFAQAQHPLHLIDTELQKQTDMDQLLLCGQSCSVQYLIAVIPVEIERTDKPAPFHALFFENILYIAAEFRRRIIHYHLHIQALGAADPSFYIFRFHEKAPNYNKNHWNYGEEIAAKALIYAACGERSP